MRLRIPEVLCSTWLYGITHNDKKKTRYWQRQRKKKSSNFMYQNVNNPSPDDRESVDNGRRHFGGDGGKKVLYVYKSNTGWGPATPSEPAATPLEPAVTPPDSEPAPTPPEPASTPLLLPPFTQQQNPEKHHIFINTGI